MQDVKGAPIHWHLDENHYLRKNYYTLTNKELLDHLNSNRSRVLVMSSMLNQCKRLGLKKKSVIRWSKEDTEYLKKMYHAEGDVFLARSLTERKLSFKEDPDGSREYKIFTVKAVIRKRHAEGWKRTRAEYMELERRHRETGIKRVFTKDVNPWTDGTNKIAPPGSIRIRRCGGHIFNVVKIENKYIRNARHVYAQAHGPIPDRVIIQHKDYDSLDDRLSNLVARPWGSDTIERKKIGLDLISKKLDRLTKELVRKTRGLGIMTSEERIYQKDITRIRAIKEKLSKSINK